jgi:hypothetical protein
MTIKRLKYWSLIQKFAKFVVKELENTIIMEVKCVQVAGLFSVEQFKAMVLKHLLVSKTKTVESTLG